MHARSTLVAQDLAAEELSRGLIIISPKGHIVQRPGTQGPTDLVRPPLGFLSCHPYTGHQPVSDGVRSVIRDARTFDQQQRDDVSALADPSTLQVRY